TGGNRQLTIETESFAGMGTTTPLATSATGTGLTANHWYRLEVDWTGSQAITGKLFDSNGTTLLNSVTASGFTSLFTSGGIGFNAAGPSRKYWDTVTAPPAFNSLTVAQLGPVTIIDRHHRHDNRAGESNANVANILNSLAAPGPARVFQSIDAYFSDHRL